MTSATSTRLRLEVVSRTGAGPLEVDVSALVLAGYTGRDRAKALAHIAELERSGVAPPARVPSVFVLPTDLIAITDAITVGAAQTSGEAEFVLITSTAGRLVGIGSDHTDRALERIDVDRAKAACAKVVSAMVWRYEDVAAHWDSIEIRSWSTLAGKRRLYQEGTLAEFLEVDRLIGELEAGGHRDATGRVLFGGTLPLLGPSFEHGERFDAELRDPILERSLRVSYAVRVRA